VPFSYNIEPSRNLVAVVAAPPVTFDESMRAIRAVALEVASQQCGALSDVREMDYVPSITELRTIAFEFIRLRAAYRCGVAFVVSNDTHYGLGRLLSALVDRAGLRIGVFRDVPEAEEWLKENNPTTRRRSNG